MNNLAENISALVVGSLLLLTPAFFIQAVMVILIAFLIWLEYFAKGWNKGKLEYIALPVSGIMSCMMIYYAPIIQTSLGWAIAFITYTLCITILLRFIWRKRQKSILRSQIKRGDFDD